MMRHSFSLLAFAAALAASPAVAQSGPVADTVAAGTEAEPAAGVADAEAGRLAQARRLIDIILPAGSFQQSMNATIGAASNLTAGGGNKESRREAHEARTGRELPQETSPFASLMGDNDENRAMMDRMETAMREAMARVYARLYDTAQLTDLERFFSTPTGRSYAANALSIMNEPEIREAMQSIMTDMLRSSLSGSQDEAMRAAMKASGL